MPISPSPSHSGIAKTTTTSTETDQANSWGPYANAGDFKGNALMILSIIFCTVLLFLAFNSIIRYLFCANCPLSSTTSNSNNSNHQQHHDQEEEDPAEKPKVDRVRASTDAPETIMVFSKEIMGTAAAECAICLSEFVEGDGIRVLPPCNHVFHVKCVDKWLALRCSCPTCRSSTVVICASSSVTSTTTGSVENV